MLNDINVALEMLLRDRGLIDPIDVDVRFDVPSEEWIESLTRPTINAFLFELHENAEKRDSAPVTTMKDGRAVRRMAPRRIDLMYLVSVLTADVDDQLELLWRVMATLMKHQEFPAELLPESLRTIEPPLAARVAAKDESRSIIDIWGALGTEPRPALCYIITAPMDLSIPILAPLVLTRTTRYERMGRRDETATDLRIQIGGTVRTAAGEPVAEVVVSTNGADHGSVTAANGRFVLRGVPMGTIQLTVRSDGRKPKTVEVTVPAESYDIVLDG